MQQCFRDVAAWANVQQSRPLVRCAKRTLARSTGDTAASFQAVMAQSNRAGNSQLRRMFIKVIRDGNADFNPTTDGPRFMRAALEFKDDPVDLLYNLTKTKEHGPKRLKAALSCCDDQIFIRDHLLPFLDLLGCDALGRGTCKQPMITLIETINQVPGFWQSILDALQSSTGDQFGCVAPIGWLALNTALHVPGARNDLLLQQVATALEQKGGAAATAAARLKVLLAPVAGSSASQNDPMQVDQTVGGNASLVAVEDLHQSAGGRHDNDFADFRDIRVMVTSEEALCQRPPFLPRTTDTQLQLSSCPEAALLDRNFRLLREDMVGPLRAELQSLNITASPGMPNPPSSSPAAETATQAASTAGTTSNKPLTPALNSRNVYQNPAILGVCLKPRPCIMVSASLPPNHRASRMKTKTERVAYWTDYGHGTLASDALVCLASPGWPLVFATIVRRDVQEIAEEQPMVGLAFEPGQETDQVLQAMARGPLHNTVLVQVSSNFLSTRPVLQCLQGMTSVPLGDGIVHAQHPQSTTYLDMESVDKDLAQLAPGLDPSQQAALEQALKLQVALIQGPPGTGKTFIGVNLCELILKHSNETILCVCYTNHALDQFLESLLDKGITQIVRIGSRSKSKRLEQYNLRELAAKAKGQTWNMAESRRFGFLHNQLESVQKQVQHFAKLLTVTAGPAAPVGSGNPAGASAFAADRAKAANETWQQRSKQLQEQEQRARQKRIEAARMQGRLVRQDSDEEAEEEFDEWRDGIAPYLSDEYPDVHEQLLVPSGMTRTDPDYLWRLWLKGAKHKGSVDRWHASLQERKNSKAASSDGSWQTAKRTKHEPSSAPEFVASDAVKAASTALASGARVDPQAPELLEHIWSLPYPLRQLLASYWRSKLRSRWSDELGDVLQEAHKLQQELRSLQDSSYEALLAQARVIGVTTTGAALHKSLLTSKPIAPKVVVIEEAAEILEAHVLTSLSPDMHHFIQIGDHKQLRPKIESFELSVHANRGHTLNVSLFERLVEAGMPHTSLQVQHRMHPDISRLIRHTYPALEDHPSVHNRSPVKGLDSSHRVIFIDHSQPELQEAKAGLWNAAAEFQSKVNMHEVRLSVAIVKYLLQQGYQPSQIVVLTPYLGQLLEEQRELSKVMEVLVSELDFKDLRKAALNPTMLSSIRVASSSGSGRDSSRDGKSGVSVKDQGSGTGSEQDDAAAAGTNSAAGTGPAAAAAAPVTPIVSQTGIHVATIDNYQGEESDIVVASLVRSNSKGSVGFLREPERINVLLSRARNGLILIGNSTTLRNASNAAARQHWGVVLDQLEASGSIMSGLPAVCQQHERKLPLLDTPDSFRVHAPDGGCTMPCNATLPCGHVCKLRCHAYDRDHSKQQCEEVVLGLCDDGHITTRFCYQSQAVCQTCVDIRRILEEEKAQIRKLEFEAAAERAKADKQKAKLFADVERLKQQLVGLSDQAAAKQAAVNLELQKSILQKELALQKERVASDLAAWEKQAREDAQQELQEMAAAAKQQAEQQAAEAAMQKQLAEQARLQQQLVVKQANLDRLQKDTDKQLQRIANKKQHVTAATEDRHRTVASAARQQKIQSMTVAAWRAALAELADTGLQGLPAVHGQLRQAATIAATQPTASSSVLANKGRAQEAAETLDLVLGSEGLGWDLLTYCSTDRSSDVLEIPVSCKRGVGLIAEQKWVDAMQIFSALQQDKSIDSTDASIVQALVAICEAQLGLQVSKATAMISATSQRSAPFKIPLPGKQPKLKQPVSEASDGTEAAAGADSQAAKHPLVHLAAAVTFSQRADIGKAVNSKPAGKGGISVTGFRAQQTTNAQAAGEALAFLLHPAVYSSSFTSSNKTIASQLPAALIEVAKQLILVHGRAAFSVSSTGLGAMLGTGGQRLTGGISSSNWEEKAASSNSKTLQELVKMIGLDPVKREMFNLADQVALDKQRGRGPNSRNFNVCFYGNPGTGKTTVARLYAKLLEELKVLPKAAVEETSGAALVAGGLTEIKAKLKKLDEGGLLFIDEAYQLDPAKNPLGAQVLDYLLPEIENRRGKLVVVLAGYQKPMEEKIMAYNEGLPSRFPLLFKFPDYDDDQLLQILKGQLESSEPKFRVEDEKYARIAARRLGHQRDSGAPGFGNARAVRNLIEASISRQSARLLAEKQAGLPMDSADLLLLKRDDLLGPKELDVSNSKPLKQLNGLRGLHAVKQSVDTLLGLIRTNAELEEMERPLKDVCLNRVFVGNPGTGKTTLAGIYGRVLHDLGLLSKGDVIVKVPADFLGSVLGESEKKTLALLEEARGSVLVIDEAYGLHAGGKNRDPYKEAVLDTIVAKVQGVPGDDRCVLLLGYPDQMEAMMREANPGLARRFQLSQAWVFEDYGKEDLLAITRDAARKRYGWRLGWPELQAALNTLDQERRRPNFGNAGAVNNLLANAALKMEARTSHMPPEMRVSAAPVPEDFMSEADAAAAAKAAAGHSDGTDTVFADLIGCKSVLAKLKEWQATIQASKRLGKDPLDSFELNFTFVGSPGTGKTTVARRVGMLFKQLGLLASEGVVECSAGDFVTGYANQASGKTREMFEKALGQVLFIDEAYRLNPKIGGPFMSEVLDEICQILTDKKFMGKMVVVLAGYEQQIEELLATNPGLKSRFSERLMFPDFSVEDAVQLLKLQLGKQYGLELSSEATAQLPALMTKLVEAPGWANGRDVGTWVKRIFRAYSLRLQEEGGQVHDQMIVANDLEASLRDFLDTKKTVATTSAAADGKPNLWDAFKSMAFDSQQAPTPAAPATSATTATDTATATQAPLLAEEDPKELADNTATGFGGLSNQFLKDMQSALESLGHDLTSPDIMQQLASDTALSDTLLPLMGGDAAVLAERVRQWQQAIQQQLEVEKEAAKKRQRPVWRCAACGRYGCPVAPYIESYQEF